MGYIPLSRCLFCELDSKFWGCDKYIWLSYVCQRTLTNNGSINANGEDGGSGASGSTGGGQGINAQTARLGGGGARAAAGDLAEAVINGVGGSGAAGSQAHGGLLALRQHITALLAN